MYNGDRAIKQVLVDHGFRLPSALDNRPLKFEEFEEKDKTTCVCIRNAWTMTKLEHTDKMVEQNYSSYWFTDPKIEVRPTENQIDDLLSEIQQGLSVMNAYLLSNAH